MEKVSTLAGMEGKLTEYRRNGNSTRLIDNAIQIIFSGKICVVEDADNYVGDKGSRKYNSWKRDLNMDLFKRIKRRISFEAMVGKDNIFFDEENLEISLVNPENYTTKMIDPWKVK